MNHILLAYEPTAAIGSGQAMTPVDAQKSLRIIRQTVADMFNQDIADHVRILYGGSVDRVNASTLVKEGNVSGFLVGRQSLDSKDFVEIIKSVDSQ